MLSTHEASHLSVSNDTHEHFDAHANLTNAMGRLLPELRVNDSLMRE